MAESSGSENQSRCVMCSFCNRQCIAYPTKNDSSHILAVVDYGKSFWDILTITPACIESHCHTSPLFQRTHKSDDHSSMDWKEALVSLRNARTKKKECININGMQSKGIVLKNKMEDMHFCVFLKELISSDNYRQLVVNKVLKTFKRKSKRQRKLLIVKWCLLDNLPQIIDYEWNVRMRCSAIERQHFDTAMSWLSTLGGACSALGDYDIQFAEKAEQISFQQMDIALRIGDPAIVSRCRLYLAISFIQRCSFKIASTIIRQEYYWAHSFPKDSRDKRLINMCHGIWKKLQYEKKKANRNGHVKC
ncbi:uncharacterized protein LOC135222729 [Macrobrachium nipponense]|uniref:uncharacterized protein LOC135222729 n=1 Tax=Macrobrachium nipponense TaxID=159736 RepID=UPI0030C7C45F